MKEMRLFEIGFKDRPRDTSYSEKFHVAANTAEEAIEKGRAWLGEDFDRWWEEDGQHEKDLEQTEEEYRKDLVDDRLLSRVYDEGMLIV